MEDLQSRPSDKEGRSDIDQVDLTPSWGEVGRIVHRLAMSGERRALEAIWPDVQRAFASAQALNALMPGLSDEQLALASTVMVAELDRQQRP